MNRAGLQSRRSPSVDRVVEQPQCRPPDPFAPLGDIGSAVTVALAGVVTVVQAFGAVSLPVLRPWWGGALTLGLFGLLFGAVVAIRRRARPRVGQTAPRPALLLPLVPAAMMATVLAGSRLLPVGRRTEWYQGGDHGRHLVLTVQEQAAGTLSYLGQPYPRAWHTLVAASWSAAGLEPLNDVVAALDLSSVLVWGLSTVLTITTAAWAASLGSRAGLQPTAAALGGLLAGVATLVPAFLGNYQALGFETSILSAVILAVIARTQAVEGTQVQSLIVAAAAVVVLANTWQLLLPVAGLAALRSGLAVIRRHGRWGWWLTAGLAAVAGAASAPAMVAVITRVGLRHATDAGVRVPLPWLVLVAAVGAGMLLAARGDGQTRWALALSLLPALTGLVVAATVGITLDTYYSSKLLWHSAALGLAPLAVGVVVVAGQASHRSSVVRVVATGLAALAVLWGMVQPAGAFAGAWSTTDGALVLRMLDAPDAASAQVVWSGTPRLTDTVTRGLLDARRPAGGDGRTPQGPLTLDYECDLLREAARPTVLSDRPEAAVASRYACVPGIEVVAPAGRP